MASISPIPRRVRRPLARRRPDLGRVDSVEDRQLVQLFLSANVLLELWSEDAGVPLEEDPCGACWRQPDADGLTAAIMAG